jgi:opacity protein-like surface antigen
MRLNTIITLTLLCCSTGAAFAQDTDIKWYAGLRGSLAFEGSINTNANLTPPVSTKANFDVGGGVSTFWGIDLSGGFDVELETMYRYQPLGDGVVNGTSAKIGGYGQMFAPMVNAYWTVPVDFPVKPYIGGGVGYAWNEVGINSVGATTFQTLHHDDWRLAYNAMAGIVIPESETSRFTIGYRWLHEDIGINCGSGITCSGNMNSQSIDVGFMLDL